MRTLAKRAAMQLLRAYKRIISPMFPPACRYVPTCSEYAMEAIDRFGAVRGGVMALWRLLRCHPLTHGGYDPVVRRKSHACEINLAWTNGASTPERLSGFTALEDWKRNS